MSYTTNVVSNYQTAEYGKFIQFSPGDTNYPAVSVTQLRYLDSTLFPPGCSFPPISSVDIFPKYAVLVHDTSNDTPNNLPFGDNSSSDAFGRLRVTEPTTLFDSKNIYSKNVFLFDEVLSGTATANFSAFDSCVDLQTTASGDYAIRQSRMRFNYQPGKSMQYMFTGLFAPQANIIKRVGCFQSLTAAPYEPSDGIFMEVTSSGPAFRVVKTQGTYHTHYAPQSAWNVDRLDGTGPSGINLDFTKAVLFTIDYEWLSVGRVRFGFYIEGKCYYAHYNGHRGELTSPYMTYSNQPIRYEIRQTGLGSGLLRQICSTVIVEGGSENVGKSIAVDGAGTNVQNSIYTPVLALRINPNQSNIVLGIKNIEVLNTGGSPGKPAKYALFYNPLITGGTLSFSEVSRTPLLSAAGNSSLTVTEGPSGYKMLVGFAALGQGGQTTASSSEQIDTNLGRFGIGIQGNSDTLVLAAQGLGDTTTIYGTINVIERA